MLLGGGGGFGGGSQKSPQRGLRRWPGCWRGDFHRFDAEGGEISAAAVRVGCQRRPTVVFRVVSWRGEVTRRRKSHGGRGSMSGGFVGWKNELGALMFVGLWVVLGSLAEKCERKSVPVCFTWNLRMPHQICAESRRSIDSNQISLFFRTELVSNNVFAKIVSEG